MNVVGKSGSAVHVSAYISITTVKRLRLANIQSITHKEGQRSIQRFTKNSRPLLLFGIKDRKLGALLENKVIV